jgi:hypothetical protein
LAFDSRLDGFDGEINGSKNSVRHNDTEPTHANGEQKAGSNRQHVWDKAIETLGVDFPWRG